MSSEERRNEEEGLQPEEPPREEILEEPQGTGEVQEPVEVGGSEDPGVVPPEEEPGTSGEEVPTAAETLAEEESPPGEPVEITYDEVAVLADELEAARGERDAYLDDMRRMKAELENSRKRQERERERLVRLASERLVTELLPVLDNLERALEAEGDVREGVAATREQLLGVLGREGLVAVESNGESFDPAVHEAVMGRPSEEHEEGTILQTFERGYTLNGKAIRPAKVVVAR